MERAKERQKSHLRRLVRNGGFEFTDTFKPYTSGEIGPYYVQSAAILKNGSDFYIACKDMESLIRETVGGEGFDMISGGETRDWMFSFPIQIAFQKPQAMLYKNGKIYGASKKDIKDRRVIHIADLNNEGSSPRDSWIPAIRNAGGIIENIYFFVDRLEDGVEEMKKLRLNSYSLVPLDDTAWNILLDDRVITRDIYNNLNQRMEDKDKWAIEMLRSKKGLETLANLYKDPKTTEKARNIINTGYPNITQELREGVAKKLDINIYSI